MRCVLKRRLLVRALWRQWFLGVVVVKDGGDRIPHSSFVAPAKTNTKITLRTSAGASCAEGPLSDAKLVNSATVAVYYCLEFHRNCISFHHGQVCNTRSSKTSRMRQHNPSPGCRHSCSTGAFIWCVRLFSGTSPTSANVTCVRSLE